MTQRILKAQVNDVRRETENTRKLEAVFRPGIFRIFFGGFRQIPVVSGRIRPEKIRKIPGGNTASMFQIFTLVPYRIR
jgi:hypothetical protein